MSLESYKVILEFSVLIPDNKLTAEEAVTAAKKYGDYNNKDGIVEIYRGSDKVNVPVVLVNLQVNGISE